MNDQFRIDSHKLMYHPHRVVQLLDGKDDWGKAKSIYPIYVEISPVGGCNHKCLMCGVDYVIMGNLEKGIIPQLNADVYAERFEEMGALGIKSFMFAGAGEPLLHRRINDLVSAAHTAGIDTSFTTNGVLLDRLNLSGVSWVKVSINGGNKESYARVHQTKESDFDRVVANVRDAVKRKGGCTIGIQLVLLPENKDSVDDFRALGEEIGADYVVVKPFSQHKFSINRQYENFDPRAIKIADSGKLVVRKEAMEAVTAPIPYTKCQSTPFLWAYLEADGDLYGCSAYLLDDRFNYGNLNTHTFKEVWQGEKRKANWDYVRNHLDIHECRQSCRMNEDNIYMNDLIHGVPHQNFI